MSRTACGLVAVALIAATSFASTSFTTNPAFAQTPSWTPPADNARCPSKWGAGDERGSGNHMKPQSVLNAAKLIKTGEVIELGHVLHAGMPVSRGRSYEMLTKRTTQMFGSNRRGSNEEIMLAEMGQVGTQFDGFAHQTHENTLYNCFKMDDVATRNGFTKLGIEKVGALMTRGVLIDVAAYKGVDMLGDSYEITVDDLEGALKKENLTLQPGDAVIIHTGWGKLWDKDNVRYMKSNPGIGVKAAEWLIAKEPMLMGSDNTPVEVSPPADPMLSGPIHQMALVIYGVHLLEHLKLDELAAKGVHEFAFIIEPLKFEGGTGSSVAPIAVH
jgi:kynurenine formamidase